MNALSKLRRLRWLIALNLFLLLASVVWYGRYTPGIQLAIAKSQPMYAAPPQLLLSLPTLQTLTAPLTAGKKVDFVSAMPVGKSEAQGTACAEAVCAHVTYYNYTDGGTLEAFVNQQTQEIVRQWADPNARPGGSLAILPKALAIAAQDVRVTAVLGDIGAGTPLMIPMSGWLMDDDCRQDWCVDLTFQDPAGTGKVFHVFVNLQKERVARTFYTRGRPDRSLGKPLSQRQAYSNGCKDQNGWHVCWEMTANDGVNFYEATFQGRTIFDSAKVGQIEAWYPSWPGGYRDEIGFSASVPPYGGTEVITITNGFEVRQLFTEFTKWPNCICCYRYQEIMRFMSDGTFENEFISFGPGCDDLSIYRPFWRIDVDLNGTAQDNIWLWQINKWVEATTEFETSPFLDDLSPDGYKFATFDGNVQYLWQMDRTDPLGLDQAHLFALQKKAEGEGNGSITPGSGDTYQPPRQWLNGEPLSGSDIVIWFVPSLSTKKSVPWWCMPDPDPDFSPCYAILRAKPGALHQPTAEEIAEAQPTATIPPQPTLPHTPEPTATPRHIDGDTPEEIILNAGCGACHTIGALGEAGKVGPDLTQIGANASQRIAGVEAAAYIRQSILTPNAFIAPECPNGRCLPNIMPQDYALRLSPEQLDVVVAFLAAQTTPPNPTPMVIGGGGSAPLPKVVPAKQAMAQGGTTVPISPSLSIQLLLVTLVFLLTLYRLIKLHQE